MGIPAQIRDAFAKAGGYLYLEHARGPEFSGVRSFVRYARGEATLIWHDAGNERESALPLNAGWLFAATPDGFTMTSPSDSAYVLRYRAATAGEIRAAKGEA